MGQKKISNLHIVTDIKIKTGITTKMIIPKKNRVAIYESLFKDGVMVAIKDFNLPKHNELENQISVVAWEVLDVAEADHQWVVMVVVDLVHHQVVVLVLPHLRFWNM